MLQALANALQRESGETLSDERDNAGYPRRREAVPPHPDGLAARPTQQLAAAVRQALGLDAALVDVSVQSLQRQRADADGRSQAGGIARARAVRRRGNDDDAGLCGLVTDVEKKPSHRAVGRAETEIDHIDLLFDRPANGFDQEPAVCSERFIEDAHRVQVDGRCDFAEDPGAGSAVTGAVGHRDAGSYRAVCIDGQVDTTDQPGCLWVQWIDAAVDDGDLDPFACESIELDGASGIHRQPQALNRCRYCRLPATSRTPSVGIAAANLLNRNGILMDSISTSTVASVRRSSCLSSKQISP